MDVESVTGTLMAIVILAVFDNGLVLMQVPSFYQEVFRGGLLLAAVIFDEVQRRSRDVRMRIDGDDSTTRPSRLRQPKRSVSTASGRLRCFGSTGCERTTGP